MIEPNLTYWIISVVTFGSVLGYVIFKIAKWIKDSSNVTALTEQQVNHINFMQKHYVARAYCANCNVLREYFIEKGKPRTKENLPKECSNCGCKSKLRWNG